MAETNNHDTPEVSHADSFSENLTGGNDVDDTFVSYDEYLEDKYQNKNDYGEVEERGTDIELHHPVDDVEELKKTAHLAAQLRAETRTESSTLPREAVDLSDVAQFDAHILSVIDTALSAEEIDVAELSIDSRFAKAIYIREARGLSYQDLIDYLENSDKIAHEIGFTDGDDIPSRSTFSRRKDKLTNDEYQAITRASTRAVYAVYRNGLGMPDAVQQRYGLHKLSTELNETELSEETKREALRNWVRLLLDKTTESLTFDRAENARYDMTQVIGLVAHSAAQQAGLEDGSNTAGFLYDDGLIPGGNGVYKQILSLSRDDVFEQFLDAHCEIFHLGKQRGFFDDERNFTCDTTGVDWYGEETEFTVNQGDQSDRGSTSVWRYTFFGVMETDARFTLGIRLHENKDEVSGQLEEFLSRTGDGIDIDRLVLDGEFNDSDVINAARNPAYGGVIDGWVINTKIEHEIEEKVKATPKGEPANYTGVAALATPNPNLFLYPHADAVQTSLDAFASDGIGDKTTHKAFLTDLLPDETSAEELFTLWWERWSIEAFVNELKHHFHPVTESPEPVVRLFMMNMSVLFFNWHVLINRCPSPRLALRLNPTHNQLLSAIRDVVFTEGESDDDD